MSKLPFPTRDNLCKFLPKSITKTMIEEKSRACRPILIRPVADLAAKFLEIKVKLGIPLEKSVYTGMKVQGFINRLISKRPLTFYMPEDVYLLRTGQTGSGGFEHIGTPMEKAPLTLSNYISYDEMQISALIGLSGPTIFINSGSRANKGIRGADGSFEETGIYSALVGARFERRQLMEYVHMVIDKKQNTKLNGYGKDSQPSALLELWSSFYHQGQPGRYRFPSYDEVVIDVAAGSKKYADLGDGRFLNLEVYKQRIEITILTFLLEAQYSAEQAGRQGYCHIVGLGLGVWMVTPQQSNAMVQVYEKVLSEYKFPNISDINFSWFSPSSFDNTPLKNQQLFTPSNGNKIKIHISNRDPADKLKGEDEGKLLVAMFAWDGNSFVGNEYWVGALTASGDPAAACSSIIPELLNPEVNVNLSQRCQIFEIPKK